MNACASGKAPSSSATRQPLQDTSSLKVDGKTWKVGLLVAHPNSPGRIYAQIYSIPSSETALPEFQLVMSDDLGESWLLIPSDDLPQQGLCTNRLILDYTTPDILYATTCRGLYRWSNNRWELVTSEELIVLDTAPNQQDTFWATKTEKDYRAGGAVWSSTDSGQSWTLIDDSLAKDGEVISSLAINPLDPNVIYAEILPNPLTNPHLILRRYSPNDNWVTLPNPNSKNIAGAVLDRITGALYVTTGRDYTTSDGYKLWRSENADASKPEEIIWDLVYTFDSVGDVDILSAGWSPNGTALYADFRNLVKQDESNYIMVSQLNVSLDNGETWQPVEIP
jgi:hypothetical protein